MVLRARKGERIEKHHDVRRGVSFGDPAEIRTPDTLLKRQVLCRLSYWVIFAYIKNRTEPARHLAGMAGFEPTDKGVKVLCLTPWRHPIKDSMVKITARQSG